jgi:predicted metal-dependent hydrolase
MKTRVIRSKRRTKTVSARLVNGVCEIRVPAKLSEAELEPIIQKLVERLKKKEIRQTLDDNVLERSARSLNRRYFDGKLQWNSIKWVTNQEKRVGSCTYTNKTIRISHRVASLPYFVRDYVIVHELAHLVEPNHSSEFWKLVERYPRTERARGYLMALGAEPLEEEPGT